MKRIFILLDGGNVELSQFNFNKEDVFICADGGYKRIIDKNLSNKVILIGDFDSLEKNIINKPNVKIIEFPKDKNFTDGELTVRYVCKNFDLYTKKIIIGGITDRIDHTLGNLLMLVPYAEKEHYFEIYGNNLKIYISHKNLRIKTKPKRIISIIPLKKICNVKTYGLRWKITNEDILPYKTKTLRNEAVNNNIYIDFKKGIILVVETW